MSKRAKVLVISDDLELLSKIYLALIHRNFKAEASDRWEEAYERIKRFRPAVVITAYGVYQKIQDWLKLPAVIMTDEGAGIRSSPGSEVQFLEKPFNMHSLMTLTEQLVV